MNTILLPTDFSQNSYDAIKYTIELFKHEECRFVLVNAYQTPKAGVAMIVSIEDLLHEESKKELDKLVARLRRDFYAAVMDITVESRHGDVVSVLKRVQKDYRADLVAMGTQGATGLKGIFMGSVTMAVIKNVDLPVLAVPSDFEFEGVKRIGLAWDKEKNSDHWVLDPIVHLAKEYDAEIDVVYVGTEKELVAAQAEGSTPDFNFLFRKVEHHFETVEDSIIENGIRSFIKKNNIDIMAMIARKHDFMDRLIHGSHSAQMAKESEIPLLILKDQ